MEFQGRPIIVCFENEVALTEFAREGLRDLTVKDNLEILIESDDFEEKEIKIDKASNRNSLTFMNKAFGRGTDFVVRDPYVEKNGGVLLILTFSPEEKSDYLQILSRVASHGIEGSIFITLKKE